MTDYSTAIDSIALDHKLLTHYGFKTNCAQKWRRGKKIKPIPPYLLGQAIDKAINFLRQQK